MRQRSWLRAADGELRVAESISERVGERTASGVESSGEGGAGGEASEQWECTSAVCAGRLGECGRRVSVCLDERRDESLQSRVAIVPLPFRRFLPPPHPLIHRPHPSSVDCTCIRSVIATVGVVLSLHAHRETVFCG